MSTVAETPARPRRARPTARPRTRRPVAGGVLWIVVLGLLLAGVVAINVVVLQDNIRLDRLGSQKTELRADIARLSAQLSSAAAAARIEREARNELGLVPADPATTRYVELQPR